MKSLLFFITILCLATTSTAQFQINGDASLISCTCYELTPNLQSHAGSVWNTNLIDLNNSFDFTFDVYLGCNGLNGGADGMVFALQPVSTSAGVAGGGMGFQGITPSIGIPFDTWQNGGAPFNDPSYDHISINANGDIHHGTANELAAPVQASATSVDIEDCQNHVFRVVWDAITTTIDIYFDGALRISYTGNIIANIFGGNPNVYWGFTGATGWAANQQQFCLNITPAISTTSDTVSCLGSVTQLVDSSHSTLGGITNWQWDLGDGTTSNVQNPTHTYAATGVYPVQLTITDNSGCTNNTSFNITITDLSATVATSSGLCGSSTNGQLSVTATTGVSPYSYLWDQSAFNQTNSTATGLSAGSYTVTVTDFLGCEAIATGTINQQATITTNTTVVNPASCFGSSDGIASVTAANGISPYSYVWSSNASSQITNTATGLSEGWYYVTISDVNLCTAVDSIQITEPTEVEVITTSSANPACYGQIVTLDATATGGNGGFSSTSYSWGTGVNSSSFDSSITTTTTFNVTATDAVGCSGDTTITVNVWPALIANTVGTPNYICEDSSAVLSVTGSGGMPGATYLYEWVNMGSNDSTITITPTTYPDSINYLAVLKDNCSMNDTDTVTIYFHLTPNVIFTTNNNEDCDSVTVYFTNQTINTLSCFWDFGDNTTSSICNPSHFYGNVGSYDVTLNVISSDGCPGSTTQPNAVEVHEAPKALFNIQPAEASVLQSIIYFTNESTGPIVNIDWTVYNTDTVEVLFSSQSLNLNYEFPFDTGTYPVKLHVNTINSCADSSIQFVTIGPEFLFYTPNAFTPNNDGINDVFFPLVFGNNSDYYELLIFDRWGTVVFSTKDIETGWDGSTTNSSLAKQGTYVWKVFTRDYTNNNERKSFTGAITLLR